MMNLADLVGKKDFFAKEFILWLWYLSENENSTSFKTDDGYELIFIIDNKLTLEEQIGEQQAIFKGGSPSDSIEAKYSLQAGKVVKECSIKLIRTVNLQNDPNMLEWSAIYKSTGMKLTNIKLPLVEEKDQTQRLLKRAQHLESFYEYIQLIYKEFLKLRLNKDRWDETVSIIQNWIKNV